MFWFKSDRDGYVSAMTDVLANFFSVNAESS